VLSCRSGVEIEVSPYKRQGQVLSMLEGIYSRIRYLVSSTERSETEWAEVEWNYSGIEGFDNKVGNNLGLSLCAVPRSAVACAVAYFRRTRLLSEVSERGGID